MRLPTIAAKANITRAALAARGGRRACLASSIGATDQPVQMQQLAELATADIVESQKLRGAIDPRIEPLWRPISLCGPVFTAVSYTHLTLPTKA